MSNNTAPAATPQKPQGNSEHDNSNAGKLQKMLGFDAAKRGNITQDAFSEAVKEINEARVKEVKEKAKELLVKAMGLREQMVKTEKEFNQQKKKFDKELGKILKQIQGALSGKTAEEIEEEQKKDEEKEKSE